MPTNKPETVTLQIRVAKSIYEDIKIMAENDRRTMSNQTRILLEDKMMELAASDKPTQKAA